MVGGGRARSYGGPSSNLYNMVSMYIQLGWYDEHTAWVLYIEYYT
jgi:hypothetical protein